MSEEAPEGGCPNCYHPKHAGMKCFEAMVIRARADLGISEVVDSERIWAGLGINPSMATQVAMRGRSGR